MLHQMIRATLCSGLALSMACVPVCLGASELLPPGHRPVPLGVHAIKAGTIITEPGESIEEGVIVVRDGVIEAVGKRTKIPADARVWEFPEATVYAGFIDPYVVLDDDVDPLNNSGFAPIEGRQFTSSGGINFYGIPGQERDQGNPGPSYELNVIRPEFRSVDGLSLKNDDTEPLRELGFTAANVVPGKGVIRGTSTLVQLGDSSPNRSVLKSDVFQHVALDASAAPARTYPQSLMGSIAAIRQTFFDAQHYHRNRKKEEVMREVGFNESLEALRPVVDEDMAVVIEPGSVLMVERASIVSDELQVDSLILASGQEWRRPDLVAGTNKRFIVPVNYPKVPEMPTEADWNQISLDQLRAWDWAPENIAVLRSNDLEVALTTFSLKDKSSFRANLKKSIERGLSEEDALAALTTNPAEWCGLEDQLGTIEKGKLANLTIVRGSYFDPEAKLDSVWIAGRHFRIAEEESDKKKAEDERDGSTALTTGDEEEEEKIEPDVRVAESPLKGRGPISPEGRTLFRNATIWTSADAGVLKDADLLMGRDGKIDAIGEDLKAPRGTVEIDATGLHLTAGLIDCHSHSFIVGGVNEGTLPSTAMVRIADVVNSESYRIHQQLAGGLTAANLLHGSANPIGGQNCVVKLRPGAGPEQMKLKGAIEGIKFALGENVKQSNWGDDNRSRFPQSRMGVPVFMANRFTAAQQYLADWKDYERGRGAEPRRNLELEALGEIINGERLIHCHSYRQDEILAFLRTMESFGVQVGTLQHILEGYKVANEIAEHGAGASTFSDWWAYKFEVIDAIPYNAALMHDRGILVSINSDSSDHARRMNTEAAKAVKYGGVPEPDALNMVTINAAKQLRVDDRIGSLEKGKDADIAVWSANPLSTTTACLQTWVDGRKVFDRALEDERVRELNEEREALLAKARKKSDEEKDEKKEGEKTADDARALFFRRALEHSQQFHYSCCDQVHLN